MVVLYFISEFLFTDELRMDELWSVNLGNAYLRESGGWPTPSKLQNLLHMVRVNSAKSNQAFMNTDGICRTGKSSEILPGCNNLYNTTVC